MKLLFLHIYLKEAFVIMFFVSWLGVEIWGASTDPVALVASCNSFHCSKIVWITNKNGIKKFGEDLPEEQLY